MSTKLSFKAQLDRRDGPKVVSRVASSSPVDLRIDMHGELPTPVSFALLLKDNGLNLAEAHDAVTKLAAKGSIKVRLRPRDVDDFSRELEELGLKGRAIRRKADVS